MQVHDDKQMQHVASDRLQRSASNCHEEDDGDYYILDRAAFNQGINAQYDIIIQRGGAVPTIIAKGPHAVAVPVRHGKK